MSLPYVHPLGRRPMGTALRCWTCWTATKAHIIKSASMMVKGANAYGMLKGAASTALIRINTFDITPAVRQASQPGGQRELDNNINLKSTCADIHGCRSTVPPARAVTFNKDVSPVRPDPQITGICDQLTRPSAATAEP